MLSIRIGEEAVLKTVALNGVQGSNPWGSAEGSSILLRPTLTAVIRVVSEATLSRQLHGFEPRTVDVIIQEEESIWCLG